MATTEDLVRFRIEETPRPEGAVTTTPYRLSTDVIYLPVQEAGFQPAPEWDERGDEVRGVKGVPPNLVNAYAPEGTVNIRAYANILTYLFAIAGWDYTHTAGDGVILDPDGGVIPAGAHRWVYEKRGGITNRTGEFTIVYADEEEYIQVQGAAISEWTLNPDGAFTSNLIALVWGRLNSDPSLTPTYDSWDIPNFRRGDMTLDWLADSATFSDFNIAATNPSLRLKDFGTATSSYFPDRNEFDDANILVTGAAPKTTLADADLDAFMAGDTWSATAKWVSPTNIGITSYPYSLWIEMPAVQYVSGTVPAMRNVRRFPMDLGWQAAIDEGTGVDCKITIVSGVAAIETYV